MPPVTRSSRKRTIEENDTNETATCAICLDDIKNSLRSQTNCNHIFHTGCIAAMEMYRVNGRGRILRCPLCRTPILSLKHLDNNNCGERIMLLADDPVFREELARKIEERMANLRQQQNDAILRQQAANTERANAERIREEISILTRILTVLRSPIRALVDQIDGYIVPNPPPFEATAERFHSQEWVDRFGIRPQEALNLRNTILFLSGCAIGAASLFNSSTYPVTGILGTIVGHQLYTGTQLTPRAYTLFRGGKSKKSRKLKKHNKTKKAKKHKKSRKSNKLN
jgi:hypothetical protein